MTRVREKFDGKRHEAANVRGWLYGLVRNDLPRRKENLKSMDSGEITYGTRRLLTIPPINILINILGAAITFIWFSLIQPGLSGGGDLATLRDRAIFVVVLVVMVCSISVPVQLRWFLPLIKEFKMFGRKTHRTNMESTDWDGLSKLVGKIFSISRRSSVINLLVWLASGLVFMIAPRIFPQFCPWDEVSAGRISAWSVFLGAPIVVTLAYFISESWIRSTVTKVFPAEVLRTRPRSPQINVLSRLLIVSVMIGIMPPIVFSHITLQQITEIQNGNQSIANFLNQMPLAIGFLLTLSVTLAVILSSFLARSVSGPLRQTESAMNRIGSGDLSASVKVVSNDEIGAVGEGFNNMADGLRERNYIRETFGRYLSDDVVKEILQSPDGVKLGGELRNITILVSDLRGFTTLTDSLEPHTVIEILNRYFEKMTDVIIKHGGTIDEFTGDGILVFFGAPKSIENHAIAAVNCALDMQKCLNDLNAENNLFNLPELRMGIGINTGDVVVGNIGSDKRKKYGAVGSPINIAFRVESLTGEGEVLVTPAVYNQIDCLKLGEVRETTLKGFDKPIALRRVISY